MRRKLNFVFILGLLLIFIISCSQKIENVTENPFPKKDEGNSMGRKYIFPVDNSESFNPRDRDYKLVHNWEFNNKSEFLADWKRLDGIRGNQIMYYRDNDANYGFKRDGANGYLHMKTLYHNPRVVFHETWPRPYDLSYEYSGAECTTKEPVLYGYFEARLKVPRFKGAHCGFWLFSQGHKGNALEIDIMEATSEGVVDTRRHVFTSNFSEYNHTRGDLHKQKFVYHNDFQNTLSDDFHIYAVEWTPFDLRFYIDNQLIKIDRIPEEYEIFPCYVRLGVEVDHWNPPNKKVFDPLVVDYVKVYQKDNLKQGYQRPQIDYKDKIVKEEEWVVASVKNPSPAKNYYWETDGNATHYIDDKNDIHVKLNKNGSRSTIVALTSLDKSGSSEVNAWKEQVVFTNRLPVIFNRALYKTRCNEEGKGRVIVTSQDLSKYGVTSTTFNIYLTKKNGDRTGYPIETLEVSSPGEGGFWLDPQKQYWIENTVEWPNGGPKTTARLLIYPTMNPTFSPRVYMKTIGGSKKKFVDGKGVNGNQINRWSLYRTNLQNTSMKYLESYESPGSKTFCFDLSKYQQYDYFVIVHEMEQANQGKCFPTQTRNMYFTSDRYSDNPPSDAYCPRK